MDLTLKAIDFVLKLLDFHRRGRAGHHLRFVLNNDEFCIKNDEFYDKNEELCIKNEELCIKTDFLPASGGRELKGLSWKKSNSGKGNVYVAKVAASSVGVPSLLKDGTHMTRARYPNLPGGLETSCGYGCMIPSKDGQCLILTLKTMDFTLEMVDFDTKND